MVNLRSGRSTKSARTSSQVSSASDHHVIGDTKQMHVVTGGGGYVGSRLGHALLKAGHQVKLLDIRPPDDDLHEGMSFEKCDIRDYVAIQKALYGAHTVYHMASYGMSGNEQLNKPMIEEVNICGTDNIIKACQVLSVHHLIYTSTYNVIFGGQQIVNGDESLPYFPLEKHPDHYSRTKSMAEQRVLSANGSSTSDGGVLHTCALRLAGVYGPGEQRHLPRIVGYIKRGLFSVTYGARDSLVEFLHVDNLVQSHVKAGEALTNKASHIASGQAYFISDCKPVNNFEFFRPLVEGLGYTFPRISLPVTLVYFIAFLTEWIHYIVGRVYNFQPLLTRTEVYKTGVTHYFSNKKAKQELGYVPTVQNDMNAVVQWFIDHGHRRKHKQNSKFVNILNDIAIAVIFSILVLSCLPFVL